jgi:hypothetical protein
MCTKLFKRPKSKELEEKNQMNKDGYALKEDQYS